MVKRETKADLIKEIKEKVKGAKPIAKNHFYIQQLSPGKENGQVKFVGYGLLLVPRAVWDF